MSHQTKVIPLKTNPPVEDGRMIVTMTAAGLSGTCVVVDKTDPQGLKAVP